MAKKTTKKKKTNKKLTRKQLAQLYSQFRPLSGFAPPTFPQPQRRDFVGQKRGFDGFVRPDLQLYNYEQAVKAQNEGNSVLSRQFLQASGMIPSLGSNVVQPQPATQAGFGPSTQNFTPQGLGSNSVNPAVYAQGSLLGTPGRLGTLQAQGGALRTAQVPEPATPPSPPSPPPPPPPPAVAPPSSSVYAPPGSVGGVGPTYGSGGGFAPLAEQSSLRGFKAGESEEVSRRAALEELLRLEAEEDKALFEADQKRLLGKKVRFAPGTSSGAMAKKRTVPFAGTQVPLLAKPRTGTRQLPRLPRRDPVTGQIIGGLV
jgi:hypothetical protein